MGGFFYSFMQQVFIECPMHMVLWGDTSESSAACALGSVDSDSLNYWSTGSSECLVIGVMRNTL